MKITLNPTRPALGWLFLSIGLLLASACAPKTAIQAAAITASPAPTETATRTITPQPSNTPTITLTRTATPRPTNTVVTMRTKTQAAQETSTAKAATAAVHETATAQPILDQAAPILEAVGVDPQNGHLAWWSNPRMYVHGYQYEAADVIENYFEVTQFVFHGKLTHKFNQEYGGTWSFCTLNFSRADASGTRLYQFYLGKVQRVTSWTIVRSENSDIKWQAKKWSIDRYLNRGDEPNEITLVVKDQAITVYLNGEAQGPYENLELTKSAVSFGAAQDGGDTMCTYDEAWIWEIGE